VPHRCRAVLSLSLSLSLRLRVNLKLALCEQIPHNLSLSLPSNFPVSLQDCDREEPERSSFTPASAKPPYGLLSFVDSFVEVFKHFWANGLHIVGFVRPHAVAEVKIVRLRPLAISTSSLLPLLNFSTIVKKIKEFFRQHTDQKHHRHHYVAVYLFSLSLSLSLSNHPPHL